MRPSKKQKTARDSGIFLESDSDSSDSAFESVRPHKNNKDNKSQSTTTSQHPPSQRDEPAPHDYICIHRPFFDVEGENWLAWSKDPSAHLDKKDLQSQIFKPGYEKENEEGIYKASPDKHPAHKWVMMWSAWLKADVLGKKAKYCDPKAFRMSLYEDWMGWGMQEIGENMMNEFDRAFRLKGNERIEEMWIIVSAVGLWLNEDDHISALLGNKDGDTTCEIINLIGCALLTTLSAIEKAGDLHASSRFLDLALVIAYYLELSHDLPAYGIEGECVAWRQEAVKYFKQGNLDPEKGLFATRQRIEALEKVVESDRTPEAPIVVPDATSITTDPPGHTAEKPIVLSDSETEDEESNKENTNPNLTQKRTVSPPSPPNGKRKRGLGNVEAEEERDPWRWAETFKKYRERQGEAFGGNKYDITKMSRVDRAAAAVDGKDPLAGVPDRELRDNLLDLTENLLGSE